LNISDVISNKNHLTKDEILSTGDWYEADYIKLMEGYFWKHIIPYFMSMSGKEYVKHNSEYLKLHRERKYDTYEEALEDGIAESLQMLP